MATNYKVTCKTGNASYTIFDGENTAETLLLSAKITQAVNAIDSFTFSMPATNAGYASIESMLTTVEVKRGDSVLFRGRVINTQHTMSNTGMITKEVTCEGLLGYAHDGVVDAGKFVTGLISNGVMASIITAHNASSGYPLYVGECELAGLYNPTELDYCDTYEALQTLMVEGFGGEIRARYDTTSDKTYIDFSQSGFGEKSRTEIKLAVNMKEITQKADASCIVTRLYAYGAKNAKGYRLTMALLGENGNKQYIQDDDLVTKYGILPQVEFFDVGDGWTAETEGVYAKQLYAEAAEYFKTVKSANVEYSVSALDLSSINMSFETFTLYNTYKIENSLMNISAYLRVVGVTYDLLEPYNNSLTFSTIAEGESTS